MGLKQGKTLAINGHAWTNPLSEFTRPALSVVVERWMSALAATGIFVSAITEAELRYGLALMPKGRRQRQLFAQVEAMLAEEFADRILPFDSSATLAYAQHCRCPPAIRSSNLPGECSDCGDCRLARCSSGDTKCCRLRRSRDRGD
jgi:hypothetical protein